MKERISKLCWTNTRYKYQYHIVLIPKYKKDEKVSDIVGYRIISDVGVNPTSDIASGRIAEMRKRNMSCFA